MKVHLFIMNGPEKRDRIVEEAIRVSLSVFDSIQVIQNARIPNHRNAFIESYTTHTFDNFVSYEESYPLFLQNISVGDYFLSLDSDEIPSAPLLSFIKKREFGDFNVFGVQFKEHQFNNDGKLTYISNSGMQFLPVRLLRYDEGLSVITYSGAHQSFVQKANNWNFVEANINHMKHDFAKALSCFSYGAAIPSAVSLTGTDYEIVDKTAKKFGVGLDFIYKNFDNKDLIKDVGKSLVGLRHSENYSAKLICSAIDFVLENKVDLLDMYRYEKCSKECCNYV